MYIRELYLAGTAIVELPSSIKCLFGLVLIQLKNCKRLASLPTSICRLKYLEELDLTGCSALKYSPEILEPMEHLACLSLERTSVKELFSPIVNLTGLRRLNMSGCKNLEFVPSIKQASELFCLRLTIARALNSVTRFMVNNHVVHLWTMVQGRSMVKAANSVVIVCTGIHTAIDACNADHVFVWYNAFELIEQSDLECSTAFYKFVTEASVDLCKLDSFPTIPYYFSPMVKMWWICLLYAEDAGKLNSNVMIAEPKGEEDTGQEESEASRCDRFGT
ncbi:hypothetical protein DVH24_010153 [Malus domestica]|uniref:Uncharacterized protein n=1 Tax=Malus domestica TaxID=3750 RepID=A0A498JPX7_MALDO|nr:hypothetical protein DVH24_010153 [Malus domestica]